MMYESQIPEGARVKLTPNAINPLHKKPVMATFCGGYFHCDGSNPMDGPDYYLGDVMTYNDAIEVVAKQEQQQ